MSRDLHLEYISKPFKFECSHDSLSEETILIIEKYGSWFTGLVTKKIPPLTEDQVNFINVNFGLLKPTSKFEFAWCEYRKECLYELAIKKEERIGISVTYEVLKSSFYKLACIGHLKSIEWLDNEEAHDRKVFCRLSNLDNLELEGDFLKVEFNLNTFSSSGVHCCGVVNEQSNRNYVALGDWSDSFDDLSSLEWESFYQTAEPNE